MTINAEDTKEVLVGDGVNTALPFNFKVDVPEDLYVFTTSYEGVDTPLVLDVDYTVVLNANQNTNPGGTVNTTQPVPKGVPITIMRGMEFVRLNHFTDSVPPHIIEAELDRLTMYALQLKEKLDRSLHVSAATQTFADVNLRNVQARRGKIIAFDDEGNAQLLEIKGEGVPGPQGISRVSRVEVSAPAVFRQASNGDWSHTSVEVSFIWSANGVEELVRTIEVTIDPDTGLFNAPTPVDGITVSGAGTRLLKLSSAYNSIEDFIQLATITMADPIYETGDFTPAWGTGEFASDPVGDVTYTNLHGVVTLSLAAALEGESTDGAMTWDAATLPAGIRPTSTRVVPCKLRYDDSTVVFGQATLNADGSASFAPYSVSGSQLAPGVFQTGEDKGLPADWNVVYPL